MSDWFPLDLKIAEPHPGHEAHLCMAHNVGFVEHNLQEYKKFKDVADALKEKFIYGDKLKLFKTTEIE